jgi:VanZ family protein
MQRMMRIACLGYVVFLTLLLLTAHPARLIGLHGELPWLLQALMPSAHLVSFLVLAVLMLLARWPMPRWGIVLVLAVYGGMTEIVQGFVPARTPDWIDWFQDLGGLAAGAGLCWIVALLIGGVSLVRRLRVLAGMIVFLLPTAVAADSPNAEPQNFGAILSRHADLTHSQFLKKRAAPSRPDWTECFRAGGGRTEFIPFRRQKSAEGTE